MKKFTFKGGIHPPANKEATAGKPIKILPPPEILTFPMQQHIGAPATPVVKKGDRVLMYQLIGKAIGGVSANIHSSVSGEVVDIIPKTMANGEACDCVIIKNDFKDEKATLSIPEKNAPASQIAFDGGLVGMGGATFPTHIKLSIPEGKSAEYVIVNGAECEPYITSDHRVLLERGETILEGLKILLNKLGAEKGIIAIEKNKPDAIEHMKKLCKGEENISVAPLETKYPQGSEKQLINSVLKRRVPGGRGLPIDVGCVILNVDSVSEFYKAATFGTPLISRIVTVSGPLIKEPSNFEVRLGTDIKYLVESAGGLIDEPEKVIMGGPMMGTALTTYDLPVIKGCGSVLFFGKEDVVCEKQLPCIRCGRCVDACPMGLLPLNICNFSQAGMFDECIKYHFEDCIECGACTYVCPSKRHIVQYIRLCKQKLRTKGIGGRK